MSVQPLDCFDYVIGLYRGDCECYDGRPDDYNESDTDLYICDLLEPSFINALLGCDAGASVWDLLGIVRNYAVNLFRTELIAVLMETNKLKRLPFYGTIGRHKYTRSHVLTAGHYAGVRMFCDDVKSGYLKIKSIGTIFDTTGTISLLIYDNNAELINTITLNTVANKHEVTDLPSPIILPLHDDYKDNLEYFFLYQVGGLMPKNNDLSCNCGTWKPCFEPQAPCFDFHGTKNGWTQFVMVGSYYGSALPDFMNSIGGVASQMYGLTFNVELGCKVDEIVCKDELDYEASPVAKLMAVAIQHKAAILFTDKILASGELNRMLMIDREERQREKTEWQSVYLKVLNDIANSIDIGRTDCLECKELSGWKKVKILA